MTNYTATFARNIHNNVFDMIDNAQVGDKIETLFGERTETYLVVEVTHTTRKSYVAWYEKDIPVHHVLAIIVKKDGTFGNKVLSAYTKWSWDRTSNLYDYTYYTNRYVNHAKELATRN